MNEAPQITVEVTADRYRVLRHPSGAGFDEKGRGNWPDDSFTWRREQDEAIRRVADEPARAAPAEIPEETPAAE